MDSNLYFDFSAMPLQLEIFCPSCGRSTRLEFHPGTWRAWAQCRCGRGWDMPVQPNTSEAVN